MFLRFFMCFSILFSSAGCAIVELDRRTSYEDMNGDPSVRLLRKVRKKVTTRDWLVAQFDEPLYAHKLMDNKEILTWRFSTTQHHTTSILVLFKLRSAKSEQKFLHVVLQDDVVKKRWLDKYEHVDTGDYGKKIPASTSNLVSPKIPSLVQPSAEKMSTTEHLSKHGSLKHDPSSRAEHHKHTHQKFTHHSDSVPSLTTGAKPKVTLLSPKFSRKN